MSADPTNAATAMRFDYDLVDTTEPRLGLVALSTDETIERDMRRLLPAEVNLLVTRVPSTPEVTTDTLALMEAELPTAAALLPQAARFAAVAYGCTSGSSVIGPARIGELVRGAVPVSQVTEPVSALIAACRALEVRRLALLSPYVAPVSDRLRQVLRAADIETPVFGSFEEASEEKVVRIAPGAISDGVRRLAAQGGVDAVFLSCTNLRVLDLIDPLEAEIGLPVLSSNLVLGWHLMRLAELRGAGPGRLFATL